MLALVFSWLCIGWLSLVLGVAGLKGVKKLLQNAEREITKVAPDHILLFGFALSTLVVSFCSLFVRINWEVNIFFLLLGAFLHYHYKDDIRRISQQLGKGWKDAHLWLKLTYGAVILVALSTVIIEVGETDTWFYHAQSMQWIKEYAAVPGLGNIHGRFAFNSNYFVISAFYAFWFTDDQVLFPLCSFFFMILSVRLLTKLDHARVSGDHRWFIVYFLLMIFLSFQTLLLISSTSTDIISLILIVYVFLLFFEVYQQEQKGFENLILWSLVALSVTFKLSSLLIVFLLLFTIPKALKEGRFFTYVTIAVLIGLPFIARNIMISGYLLYPVPSLDILSVDWKIPMEEVQFEKDLVEGWAKQPYGSTYMEKFEDIPKILDLPFRDWLKIWWPAQSIKWQAFMLLGLLNIPLLFLSLFRKEHAYSIAFGALVVNLLFWFDQAPQPRFAYGFIFFGSALILGYMGSFFLRYLHPKRLIFIALLAYFPVLFLIRDEVTYTPLISSALLLPNYQTEIKTEEFEAHNFTLNVPSEEPPASIYWCYNSPLPCTPLPKKNVEMRGESFGQGFRIVQESSTYSNNR